MTDNRFFPERLFAAGITDLISVTPPGALISPGSTLSPAQLGKAPGRRSQTGAYFGYDWRRWPTDESDVVQWTFEGANIGLRAGRFPGVDIDTGHVRIAQLIQEIALAELGDAPVRTGRPPKRLLMYRTEQPFPKVKLVATYEGEQHLLEILGEGQQYVVHGTHPGTMLPYLWDRDPSAIGAAGLSVITKDSLERFLSRVVRELSLFGCTSVERIGADKTERAAVAQAELRAPSIKDLFEAVRRIPNDDVTAPTRDDYVKVAAAIKAAAGEHEEEGFEIFADWASRHAQAGDHARHSPDLWRPDWRRIKPPYAVGWGWLAALARGYGFDDASLEFDADESASAPVDPSRHDDAPAAAIGAETYSDQWLAEQVVKRARGQIRFVPQTGKFLVWDGSRWQIDGDLLAEDMVKGHLRGVAAWVRTHGATLKEQAKFADMAVTICSSAKLNAVTSIIKSDRSIAVPMDALDSDPWALNTPQGIVDLRTGALTPPSPDALCTKRTTVPAAVGRPCPKWAQFLDEATGGDREMVSYIKRFAGYALTGFTEEQQLTFVWGPGGNGKSVLADILAELMGDYAKIAAMDTFTAGYGEKHSTDLASLAGARLVEASETAAGKRWDDQRIKSLTGGERVTARFMRQDNFSFRPTFKLLFIGNHRPELRDVDDALRRRIQLMPFVVKPKVVNKRLKEELLREEGPAILAWMIEGCREWQQEGLAPPASVLAATADYFEEQDGIGRFLAECTVPDEGAVTTTAALFQRWVEWCGEEKEYVGKMKGFSAAVAAKGYERVTESGTRRKAFRDLTILARSNDF